jgi:hypothetical protein
VVPSIDYQDHCGKNYLNKLVIMLFFLIIVIAVLYIAIRSPVLMEHITGGTDFKDVRDLQKEIHAYSGVSPDTYMSYITNMDNAMNILRSDPTLSAQYLYRALEDLRNVGLAVPGGDSEIPQELTGHANRLGKLFEAYIMQESLQQGVRFNPAYLNDYFITKEE